MKQSTVLSIVALTGSLLLFAAFFLPIVHGTIGEEGYSGTGYQLARGEISSDSLSGIGGGYYSIYVGETYTIFYALILLAFISAPLSVFRDAFLRLSGALCGTLGIICALWGYTQFDPGDLDLEFGPGYGLPMAVVGGSLLIAGNLVVGLRNFLKDRRLDRELESYEEGPGS